MAIDEGLNEVYRAALSDVPGVTETKMMGGVCFMVNGNMLGGAHRDKLGAGYYMFRVGKANAEAAEKLGGGQVMKQPGRVMSGLYFVDADACPDALFAQWTALALSHAMSLPRK